VQAWTAELYPEAKFTNSYGTTECGGITANGRPMASKHVRYQLVDLPQYGILTSQTPSMGEICVLTPNLSIGYLNQPEKEAEVYIDAGPGQKPTNEDGSPIYPPLECGVWGAETPTSGDPYRWYRSGDIGMVDNKGSLHIVDRVSTLCRDKQGQLICPSKIEAMLEDSPYVKHAYAHASPSMTGVVALIVLRDGQVLRNEGMLDEQPPSAVKVLQGCAELRKLVMDSFAGSAAVNAAKGCILPSSIAFTTAEAWNDDNGMLNSSQKKARKKIYAYYEDELTAVAALYS